MNELIPIHNNNGIQAVMGARPSPLPGVKEKYPDWFRRMVGYGFSDGADYASQKTEAGATSGFVPGGNRVDHILSMDMAKEISMIQRSAKGKQARQYFIECERRAKTAHVDVASLTRLELLQMALNAEQERLAFEERAKVDRPKVEAHDTFMDASGNYSIGNVAKMLGKSQNWLFRELRNAEILISRGHMRNTPYQKYMHHFEVKAYSYTRSNGDDGVGYTTYVQPSGIDFIRKKLGLQAIDPLPVMAG